MNTGHDGSLTTVHANSPRDSLSRIETMVLMAGFDLPVRAIREQIASAIHLVIHIARLRDGSRRVTHVTEVGGMVGDQVELRDLFLFDYGMGLDEEGRYLGRLKATGRRPEFLDHLLDIGIEVPADAFDAEPLARRTDSFSVVQ
jgi:pilus assembly protein CpaF